MKRKSFLALIIGLISCAIFSQEKITEFKNSLKTSSSNIKDVIPIVNKKNNELTLFIADAKNVYGYKFDGNFNLKAKLSSEKKSRKYKILLGSSIDSSSKDYIIFISNKSKDKFAAVSFSFKKNQSTIKEFKLPFGEKFIQTISYNNKFYLLTGSKLKNSLYVYEYNNKGESKKNRINHTDLTFIDKNENPIKITDLLIKYTPLKKFEENTPNSIESVSDNTKTFLKNNDIIFAFDINKKITQVLTLDINNMTVKGKSFKKPLNTIKTNRKKTNSFIHGNNFFVIASTKETFSMHILNYKTGDFIKEFTINKNEKIAFKNTPIIQEGGYYARYRELEKTKKFLRKITSQNIGVSVIKNNNNYNITIGGYVKQQAGGSMMMGGFGGIPIGATGGVNFFFNPTMFAYNSFTNTKSTRIECLFDSNFNHIKDEKIKENAFDKINNSNTRNEAASTIFKYKDYFIKGDYNSSYKIYNLTKFTN